jgi:hypothetical protein
MWRGGSLYAAHGAFPASPPSVPGPLRGLSSFTSSRGQGEKKHWCPTRVFSPTYVSMSRPFSPRSLSLTSQLKWTGCSMGNGARVGASDWSGARAGAWGRGWSWCLGLGCHTAVGFALNHSRHSLTPIVLLLSICAVPRGPGCGAGEGLHAVRSPGRGGALQVWRQQEAVHSRGGQGKAPPPLTPRVPASPATPAPTAFASSCSSVPATLPHLRRLRLFLLSPRFSPRPRPPGCEDNASNADQMPITTHLQGGCSHRRVVSVHGG